MRDYYYDYGFNTLEDVEQFWTIAVPIYIGVIVFGLILGLVLWVFNSVGLTTIAKNRGLSKPWLAWIPFVSGYALGKISDDINLKKGKKSGHRKILLGMEISGYGCMLIGLIVMLAGIGSFIFSAFAGYGSSIYFNYDSDYYLEEAVMELIAPMIVALLLILAGTALLIVYTVFYYIALYNVFKAYAPNNAVLFLVLSILVSSCLGSIFLFAIRNRMPVDPMPPMGYYPPNGYPPYPQYQQPNPQYYQQPPQQYPPYPQYQQNPAQQQFVQQQVVQQQQQVVQQQVAQQQQQAVPPTPPQGNDPANPQ